MLTIPERHWRKLVATFKKKLKQYIHFRLHGNGALSFMWGGYFVWVLITLILQYGTTAKWPIYVSGHPVHHQLLNNL